MEIQIKYLYTDGTEIEQHDLVYLEGFEEEKNENYEGLCRIAFINGDKLTVYPLGHTIDTGSKVEMYFEHMNKLVKVDSREVDKALDKIVKKLEQKIGD